MELYYVCDASVLLLVYYYYITLILISLCELRLKHGTQVMSTVRLPYEKLTIALDCLLIENFTIQDKTLLEKLLTSLQPNVAGKWFWFFDVFPSTNNVIFTDVPLKSIPIDSKWFDKVLDIYQQQTPISKNSSTRLYAFALKYLAILVKSNDGLVALIETNTLHSMIDQLNVTTNLKESSVFNAYMSLLQALNIHKLGVEYVFQKGNNH